MNGPTPAQEKIIWQALAALSLLFIVSLGLGICYLFIQAILFLSAVLIPLAIAGVIAYLLDPVINLLQARGLRKTPAIAVLFISIFLTFSVFGAVVLPQLYSEASGLIEDLPEAKISLLQKSHSWLEKHPEIKYRLDELELQIQSELPKYNAKIASWIWTGIGSFFSTLGFLLGLVFIPLYVFYFLRDQPIIEASWHDYIPLQRSSLRDEIVIIISEINKHLITFFRGQVIVAMIIGTITGIGLSLIGLKYALLIGVISALFSIIPYLGVILSIAPALLIATAQSGGNPGFIGLTLGVFVLVQFCEGNFISPKIMGERTGLHPLTIIVSILIWSIILGGLLGAILAIPLTATLKVLMYPTFGLKILARKIPQRKVLMLPEQWLLAGVAVLFVGFSKAGFGGGAGILATPLMAMAFPPKVAIGVMLPLLVISDLVSCWVYRRDWDTKPLRFFLPAAAVGILLASLFLGQINNTLLKRMLGALCLGFVFIQLLKERYSKRLNHEPPGWKTGTGFGLASGITSTLAHAAGPVFAMYLLPQGYDPRRFVATTVLAFTVINLLKVPGYLHLGLIDGYTFHLTFWLAPLVVIGTLLGVWLNSHFSSKSFTKIIYVILFLSGLELITGKSLLHALWRFATDMG
jgi:predicted PurR-regulated permease PerM/uncharacterized membrane protein YfcA